MTLIINSIKKLLSYIYTTEVKNKSKKYGQDLQVNFGSFAQTVGKSN